jgi:hypothetical protein
VERSHFGRPALVQSHHGIELLVKGFLIAHGHEEPTHEIQKLCQLFAVEFPDEKELNYFLNKYTNESSLPPILMQFLEENGLIFKSLYDALRYPGARNFRNLKTYVGLEYKGEKAYHFSENYSKISLKYHRSCETGSIIRAIER